MPAGARAVAQAFPGQGWLLGAPSTQHPAQGRAGEVQAQSAAAAVGPGPLKG